jgi:predicted DNA-binding transcriptional regulator YafY
VADPAVRLLRLLGLLQTRSAWTGPALAGRLGVSDRTVRRDVDRLRQLGYPVDSELGPDGGYRLAPGAAMPPLVLDDDEAVAVAVSLRAAAGGSVQGAGDAALRALTKLEQVLPRRLRPHVAALTTMTVPLGPATADDAVAPDDLVAVAQACRDDERLRFVYGDRVGDTTERTVEPHRLVHTGRRWYLVAFDVRRAAWRTFRVDRMGAIERTGHRFVPNDPPDPAAMVARGVAVAPYPVQARAVFEAPLAAVAARVPPTVAVLAATDDGRTVLTTGAYDLDAIALHLAMVGLPFTVLDPPELRDRLRALADRLGAAATAPA